MEDTEHLTILITEQIKSEKVRALETLLMLGTSTVDVEQALRWHFRKTAELLQNLALLTDDNRFVQLESSLSMVLSGFNELLCKRDEGEL